MVYSRKKFSTKYSRKGKRTYKRKSYAKKTTPIKKIIRKEIARNTENKSRQHFATNDFVAPSTNSNTLDATIIPLGPTNGYLQIDQGPGNGSRIGNEIKTKRLTFKGTLATMPYDAITNLYPQPVQIKLWIFYDKTDPTNNPTPATNADFFKFNNSAQGFSNDLVDLWKPVNTDRYRVLTTRVYKLGRSTTSGSGVAAVVSNWANNDFKINVNFSLDLTKYYPKSVKFNNNYTDPTTRGLFAMFQAVYADGLPVTNSGQRLASLSYMLDYHYEDA